MGDGGTEIEPSVLDCEDEGRRANGERVGEDAEADNGGVVKSISDGDSTRSSSVVELLLDLEDPGCRGLSSSVKPFFTCPVCGLAGREPREPGAPFSSPKRMASCALGTESTLHACLWNAGAAFGNGIGDESDSDEDVLFVE